MESMTFFLSVFIVFCLFHRKYVNVDGKRKDLRSELKNMKRSISKLENVITALESEVRTKNDEFQRQIESLQSDVRGILKQKLLGVEEEINISDGNVTLKDCPALRVPHAIVTPDAKVTHGTTVIVDCPSPFTLVGHPRPTCNNGAFTDIPSCEKSDIFDISEMRVGNKARINIQSPTRNDPWNSAWVSGSKFLPDGRLILVDDRAFNIQLFSRDFEIEDTLSFRKGFILVFAIGIINDTTVVVTEPLQEQMEFVQVVPKLQRGRIVSTDAECYGVDVFKDTIYLACNDARIRLYDMDGQLKGKLGEHFQGPYCITINPVSENICVADWNARSVTCMTQAGGILFTYTHPNLSRPQAVLLDDLDNIVIADWDNDNIQVIKNSDKTYRNLLTSNDGILSPYSLAYRRADKTLVVGLQWTSWFYIVKLI